MRAQNVSSSLFCSHHCLPLIASSCRRAIHASPARLQSSGRITIPTLPPGRGGGRGGGGEGSPGDGPGHRYYGADSSAGADNDDYVTYKHIPAHAASFLDAGAAQALARQRQVSQLAEDAERSAEELWRSGRSHLRRQQSLVEELGVEGAVRETLSPSTVSFNAQLRQRPLDKHILEEIYYGLHGRRVERQLKRGVSWEHWITKGDGTAPIYTTSRKAQQTFAFGGRLTLLEATTDVKKFPVLLVPGAARHSASSGSSKHHSSKEATSGDHTRTVDEAKEGKRSNSSKKSPRKRQRFVPVESLVPEVAFIGRTSSGKSSLLNALLNAAVTPYGHLQGTTNTLRFYSVAERLVMVDCPGYGFYNPVATAPAEAEAAVSAMRRYLLAASANPHNRYQHTKASTMTTTDAAASVAAVISSDGDGDGNGAGGTRKESGGSRRREQQQQQQRPLEASMHHLQRRPIKRVFVCVSARGVQHLDWQYMDLLESHGIPFTLVFTKTDAAPIRFLARLVDHTRARLVGYRHCKELMLTSSLRLAGIDKMQTLVASVALGEADLAARGASFDFSSIV